MTQKKIFLSYRREDSAGQAGRVNDRLTLEFGGDSIFMDVDGIPLGTDFVKRLTAEVAGCDVLLAVIGPKWMDIDDEEGRRRIDDPNDFVRVEIGAALHRDIPVIPILLDGTKMPRAHRLPSDLQALAVRNGLDLRHATFHSDLNRLVNELRRKLSDEREHPAEHHSIGRSTSGVAQSIDPNQTAPAQPQVTATPSKYARPIGLWGIGSLFGVLIAVVCGGFLTPLQRYFSPNLTPRESDEWIANLLLTPCLILAGAFYRFILRGPMAIAAGLVGFISAPIGFEIMVRTSYESGLGLLLIPTLALVFLGIRLKIAATE